MEGLNLIKFKTNDDSLCSICLCKKEIDSEVFSCKRCKNSFHEDCIYELIKYKSECPICRLQITNKLIFDPELLIYSRDLMMYHYSAFQFIIFIQLIRNILFIVLFIFLLFIIGLLLFYFF